MTDPRSRLRNSNLNERSPLIRSYVQLHSDQNEPSSSRAAKFHETSFSSELEGSVNAVSPHYQEKNYYRNSCKRLPKGKGVLLVFIIYSIESFAFYSTLNGLQKILFGDQQGSVWIFSFLEGTAGRIVYPVAGLLADSYFGRYQVIHFGLWLLWIGFGLLAFSQAMITVNDSAAIHYVLPILSTVVISVGAGSVEVNTISFGVDQLAQGCPSEELSSYFYWYYFNRNTGILAAVLVSILIFGIPSADLADATSKNVLPSVLYSSESLLAMALISIAMITHYCLQNWYFKDRQRENPLKSIINVTYFSATVKRHPPIRNRPFRYGEGKKPRIELAKIEYDGDFSSEEVENVKTFYQILFLIFTLGGYYATYGAVRLNE